MTIPKAAAAVAVAFLVLGCSLHTVREDYPAGIELPGSFSGGGSRPLSPEPWWRSFGDAGLDRTVERVLAGNPGLLQAWSRIRQADLLALQTASAQVPEITVGGEVSRSRSTFFAGGEIGGRDVTTTLSGLSLGVSYEADLWKKLSHRTSAASISARATRDELNVAAMGLAALSAELWFAMAEQKAQMALLQKQEEVGGTFLELLELRFRLGQASALDLFQQKQQLANTRAGIPLLEKQLVLLSNRLAILMGLPPGEIPAAPESALPVLPPLPDPGLPADLLQMRPDVRAAGLRVTAADHDVGAALAELLPTLRLSATAGYQGTAVEDTLSNFIYRLAASLAGPIVDGGRRRVEVRRRRELLEERLHAYHETILRALGEVEDALASEERQADYTGELQEQIELAEATLEQARIRYGNGLSDYLTVLTALQALQRLERAELASRKQSLSDRIQLYRALGGSWTGRLRYQESLSRTVSSGADKP